MAFTVATLLALLALSTLLQRGQTRKQPGWKAVGRVDVRETRVWLDQ
jgi:hypothetical protein